MSDAKCKVCRRAGEKLFLKGDKCFTPKCTFEKKPSPPGKPLNERKHRSNVSEFGTQLREKQKIRNVYGVSEKQFSRYVKEATTRKGANPVERLFENLESRLDNTIFRLGFAHSRTQARQIVSHGHITVNGKKIDVPSYRVTQTDIVKIRDGSMKITLFSDLDAKIKKQSLPNWLRFDPVSLEARFTGIPKYEKGETGFNYQAVIEFYSR